MFVRILSICMLLYCAFPVLGQEAAVTSVSPAAGQAGAQVTVSGSGFGSVQGTGALWLGSAPGAVVSWSDTQIVATVALNATSGNAQVRQGAGWSNAVPFTVDTAMITDVTPITGAAGTVVTITGSGFGAAQSAGQVWLGNANGVVQSWSDAQIVAQVAAGALAAHETGWQLNLPNMACSGSACPESHIYEELESGTKRYWFGNAPGMTSIHFSQSGACALMRRLINDGYKSKDCQ